MQRLKNHFSLLKVLGPFRAKRFTKSKNLLPKLDFDVKNDIANQLGLNPQKKKQKITWYIVPATSLAVIFGVIILTLPKQKAIDVYSSNSTSEPTTPQPSTNINTTSDQLENTAEPINIPVPSTVTTLSQTDQTTTTKPDTVTDPIITEQAKTQNIINQLSEATIKSTSNTSDKTTQAPTQKTKKEETKDTKEKSNSKTKKSDKKNSGSVNVLKKYLTDYKDRITNWREIEF